MVANVGQFTAAIDKVYKNFSTEEVHIDRKELRGLGDRSAQQLVAERFQQQLLRARAAFLQEFRNHAVQVDAEVKKIREQISAKLEEEYGDKIAQLRQKGAETAALVAKHLDEIAQLKRLTSSQESYLAAVRHRWGLETKERLRGEIDGLKEQAEVARKEIASLSHQLLCRNELVAQLGSELTSSREELERHVGAFADERREYEEKIRSLRLDMKQQQEAFDKTLKEYELKFCEYRAKTTSELQIQDIIGKRRAEALALMEEERQRHLIARSKPTPRIGIGPDGEEEPRCAPYEMCSDTRYRVDDMGMDTSWRDYRLTETDAHFEANDRRNQKRTVPKFRVERLRNPPKGISVLAPTPGHVPTAAMAVDGVAAP
eukprot:TRINITY_DN46686_c0_g1_i1.p1 TRINITY_DN46686_c0_g1~~TRINITY_DN46686_c0_g1_i1.p1  ORF type:complete len:389 (+),score=97.06 TRINITY_DN46686_c0_g1_i1:48-1169(+)